MALAQLRNELAALERKMAALRVNDTAPAGRTARNRRRRQRRRERMRGNNGGVVAPAQQNPASGRSQGGRRRQRRRGLGVNPEGNVRVHRTELLVEVKGGNAKGTYDLSLDKFSWLAQLSKAFDRCVWHSADLIWKPAVGTTTDGLIAYGVDWSGKVKANWGRKDVLSLTPIADHPVWQSTETCPLILPSVKLMSRKEYILSSDALEDKAPGVLVYACTGSDNKTYGELWIRYDISLFGTA